MMLYVAGISSIMGHMFPAVYKFKGGKGVSSTMGMFLAANPLATIICLLIGTVIWIIFEYGSVVSFLLMTSLTVIEGIRIKMNLPDTERKVVCLILFALFLFTWYAHRKNIERLLLGKENKASIIKKTKKKLKKSVVKE
jgi:glycerol-3-phosphate acyltransferase PlsY